MDAKKLMAGNKAYWYDPELKRNVIVSLTNRDIYLMNGREGAFSPVPLSAGWFKRCGYLDNNSVFSHPDIDPFYLSGTEGIYVLNHRIVELGVQPPSGKRRIFRYLHELQNLHFALCDESLEVSAPAGSERVNKYEK